MKPVLYRYRDSESVIKHMDGYTPGEGWEPLYSQDQISSAVNAALKATAPDERVKELEAELAAAEIAIAEYRQQCLDNAAEIARLRSESEERLQNCAALVAEVERLRAAPATTPEQPRPFIPWSKEAEMLESWAAQPERKPMTDEEINKAARQTDATVYTNRFVNGSAFSFGPDAMREFVRAVEAFHGITEKT